MSSPTAQPPARWQGPLRVAIALFVAGVLVVWLIKPIGDPCPDLDRLPQGSSASSKPSLSPPLTRSCTYTAAGGTKAESKYVPWLDWIVLLLLAAVAGGVVSVVSPASGGAGERAPRAPRASRAPRPPSAPSPGPDRVPPVSGERDAAERERARRERAQRNARRGP